MVANILPVIREIDCTLATASLEGFSDFEAFLRTVSDARLPVRAEGYHMSPPYVRKVGIERLREVHDELRWLWMASMERAGLDPEAPAEVQQATGRYPNLDRPVLVEEVDGSAFLFGLSDPGRGTTWPLLGLGDMNALETPDWNPVQD
jgi:hypothetical protein